MFNTEIFVRIREESQPHCSDTCHSLKIVFQGVLLKACADFSIVSKNSFTVCFISKFVL